MVSLSTGDLCAVGVVLESLPDRWNLSCLVQEKELHGNGHAEHRDEKGSSKIHVQKTKISLGGRFHKSAPANVTGFMKETTKMPWTANRNSSIECCVFRPFGVIFLNISPGEPPAFRSLAACLTGLSKRSRRRALSGEKSLRERAKIILSSLHK